MRVAVVQYPGSNADFDAFQALRSCGFVPEMCWHKALELGDVQAVVIPGGFSYGDYLRAGAIARFSPISAAVTRFAEAGGPVLGICNGFQVLTELGLLPGALARNEGLRFVCRDVQVEVCARSAFLDGALLGHSLRLPVAHADGRYVASEETLAELKSRGQIALRYVAASGPRGRRAAGAAVNPNGAAQEIAGITNAAGNVLGLMPHPERAAERCLGNSDGRALFESLKTFLLHQA